MLGACGGSFENLLLYEQKQCMQKLLRRKNQKRAASKLRVGMQAVRRLLCWSFLVWACVLYLFSPAAQSLKTENIDSPTHRKTLSSRTLSQQVYQYTTEYSSGSSSNGCFSQCPSGEKEKSKSNFSQLFLSQKALLL